MRFFWLTLALVFLLGCANQPLVPEEYHVHADFKVYLDDEIFDFNKTEFMSTPYKHLSEDVHLHDYNPNVIHFHKDGVSLGGFFESLGMSFTQECFDTGRQNYCNDSSRRLYFYVNGVQNSVFEKYVPRDLDKILIYYGEAEPLQEVIESVTSQSCIYSEKCPVPEGFVLPEENCSVSQPCIVPT